MGGPSSGAGDRLVAALFILLLLLQAAIRRKFIEFGISPVDSLQKNLGINISSLLMSGPLSSHLREVKCRQSAGTRYAVVLHRLFVTGYPR